DLGDPYRVSTILGGIAGQRDLVTSLHDVLPPAGPEQVIWTCHLALPVSSGTTLVFGGHIDQYMRIYKTELGHGALNSDLLCTLVCGSRMVGQHQGRNE